MAIGWSEYFVIAVVVLLVFGPKELPAAARSLGQFLRQVRRFSGDARRSFEQVLRDVERAAENAPPPATATMPAAPDPVGSNPAGETADR